MSTTIGCPTPGASQPKDPVRLVDANSILRSIDVNGSAYDGIEYQAYKAGIEYVRSLIEDAPAISPESLWPMAHWISDSGVCFCDASPHCADFTDGDDGCCYWQQKEPATQSPADTEGVE